jgi:hypothetical protein
MRDDDGHSHVDLAEIWKHRLTPTDMSIESMRHIFNCKECLDTLGRCKKAKDIDEVKKSSAASKKK